MPKIETEKEEDGRWIAEIPDFRGVMAYVVTKAEAIARVKDLALKVVTYNRAQRLRDQ